MRFNVGRNAAAGLLVVMVAATGCNDNDSPTDPSDPGQVTVADDFFNPQASVASPGEVVTWSWQGSNPHDVTWDDAALPSSQTQTSGSHAVTMPSTPGEYGYHCTVHGAPGAGMYGTVVVE